MKQLTSILLGLLLLVGLSACSKDKERTDLLTDTQWHASGLTLRGERPSKESIDITLSFRRGGKVMLDVSYGNKVDNNNKYEASATFSGTYSYSSDGTFRLYGVDATSREIGDLLRGTLIPDIIKQLNYGRLMPERTRLVFLEGSGYEFYLTRVN